MNIEKYKSSSSFQFSENAVTLALQPYERYVRHLWWDVAVPDDKQDPMALAVTLRSLVQESWSLLCVALNLHDRGLAEVLSDEYMARTIGMFEQNNVGVRVASPVGEYVMILQPGDPDIPRVLAATEQILATLEDNTCWEEPDSENSDTQEEDQGETGLKSSEEERKEKEFESSDPGWNALRAVVSREGVDTLYAPLDGTAFYTYICKINHSCEPNVLVKYGWGDIDADSVTRECGQGLRAELTAVRDIHPGEELLQSYIDQSQPLINRKYALRDYGFECTCIKCVEEEAALDPSSETRP
eukprot:CAMPEP_0182435428 /NCGR_PEP_ID=MMETSP1167-20130531/75679_1 /TAXON_ID=2988 /ORGANISM="Mallomonas Sp, Strain CCMP3275" /LENGTH=299 /DNA_ID=CAMNT_0024626473 /DNA_START=441 /DNA_END=1337 /DNA_ORIENTATION=+